MSDPSDGGATEAMVVFAAIGALLGFGLYGDLPHMSLGCAYGAMIVILVEVIKAIRRG